MKFLLQTNFNYFLINYFNDAPDATVRRAKTPIRFDSIKHFTALIVKFLASKKIMVGWGNIPL